MKLVNQNKNSNPVTTDIQDFIINVAINIHNLVANVSMEILGAAQHEIQLVIVHRSFSSKHQIRSFQQI